MFVDLTFDAALKRLGEPAMVLERRIVPARVRAPEHNPYTVEYAWLFVTDRELARAIEKWIPGHRQTLIGAGGLLTEALSNAYCHGHKRDRTLPIVVRVHASTHGALIHVEDSGSGFNVSTVRKLHADKGKYYNIAGSGTRRMAESTAFCVFHGDAGRSVFFLYESRSR